MLLQLLRGTNETKTALPREASIAREPGWAGSDPRVLIRYRSHNNPKAGGFPAFSELGL